METDAYLSVIKFQSISPGTCLPDSTGYEAWSICRHFVDWCIMMSWVNISLYWKTVASRLNSFKKEHSDIFLRKIQVCKIIDILVYLNLTWTVNQCEDLVLIVS